MWLNLKFIKGLFKKVVEYLCACMHFLMSVLLGPTNCMTKTFLFIRKAFVSPENGKTYLDLIA